MPDIVDANTGTYVDLLTVVYHSVDHPTKPPQATVVLVVDGGLRLDRDELRSQIERLHYSQDEQGRPQHQPFVLNDAYHHVSWGADAATLAVVVFAASAAVQGIVGSASYDGLRKVGEQLRSGRGSAKRPQQLDDQEAIRRAKQIAAAAFKDIDSSGFTVLSVSVVDNSATVVMRYEDGSTFTVQPSMLDTGGGAIGPVVRSYPEVR
ncbi:hypothetical protein [Mycobacterium sp. 1245852.3]|uniref:hypothetical protein n=1 Tax=Mycobacterium sp. 1245852.3 TaxID=1856860 RepID=UPI0012EA3A58|nr:hypothetical protein [Mycobacterium sp. 1245852.3]